MILLILSSMFHLEVSRMYLNSIMILLIPFENVIVAAFIVFKFHYDSINSTQASGLCQLLRLFKFHYDSINSASMSHNLLTVLRHLNSIMILLILFYICIILCDNMPFKFHYDSINSNGGSTAFSSVK